MKTNTYTIAENDAGQRLDKWLSNIEGIGSRSVAHDLITKNHVLIDARPAKPSAILKLNQIVEVQIPEVKTIGLVPYDYQLDIIYEDSDVIVVNKPSGLVVHPAAGHEQDTLVNALIHHTQQLSMKHEMRPGIVHRLDKETSGLLVIAKNDKAHEHLSLQFKNKTTHRIYYSVVEKEIKSANGTFQSYLARHPVDRKRYASLRENNKVISKFHVSIVDGKWAVTHFKKLAASYIEKNLYLTYMKLKLETGRTHQIRVHLSENGHPLLGDVTYGASKNIIKKYALKRFFLHAAELGFNHPTTNADMMFKVGWPAADSAQLIQLGFSHELPGM